MNPYEFINPSPIITYHDSISPPAIFAPSLGPQLLTNGPVLDQALRKLSSLEQTKTVVMASRLRPSSRFPASSTKRPGSLPKKKRFKPKQKTGDLVGNPSVSFEVCPPKKELLPEDWHFLKSPFFSPRKRCSHRWLVLAGNEGEGGH